MYSLTEDIVGIGIFQDEDLNLDFGDVDVDTLNSMISSLSNEDELETMLR